MWMLNRGALLGLLLLTAIPLKAESLLIQPFVIVIVATDPFLDESLVQDMIERSQLSLKQTWVFAEQFPERIYADVNKRWRGELPVTHFFSRNNTEIRHLGIVKQPAVEAWLLAQQIK